MHTFGTITLLSGLALTMMAQIYLAMLTFKKDGVQGFLGLLVPGYVYWIAKRNGYYGKFFLVYFIGIVGIVIGGIILS